MFEKRVLNFYSVIIGALFIISGIGKVIDTAGFSNLIYQYGLGPLMILSPIIVLFELLLGLYLILLINPRRNSLISFILLIIFTILFAYAHFRYNINDCGCFGSIRQANFRPIFSFIRNFILIIMSFIIWIKYPKEKKNETAKWKRNLIIAVMSLSIFISGFTFKTPFTFTKSSANNKFLNQNIKNTGLSNYIKTSPDSTYLIFCFSYSCPHCWNSIENLRQYRKRKSVDSVVVFAVGDAKDKLVFDQYFQPDFIINELPLAEMDKLTDAYPTAFYVRHDSVKVIIKSELPSPHIFKIRYNLTDSI